MDNKIQLLDFLESLNDVDNIKILGCNPLVKVLTSSKFEVALRKRLEEIFNGKDNNLKNGTFFTLLMESEQEDFFQQLTDVNGPVAYKTNYIDKKSRIFGIEQANYRSALVADITKQIISRYRLDGEEVDEKLIEFVKNNVCVRQLNLRLPYNAIIITSNGKKHIWFHPLSLNVPSVEDYMYVAEDDSNFSKIYNIVNQHMNFFETEKESPIDGDTIDKSDINKLNMTGGKKYTSLPNSELLEAYDKNNKRVAIFDRKSFLTLEYKRASIWGFIFNRKGQLLLHKRSNETADNRGLWDKSTGGHVDLTDVSTTETAKREFIEELYMRDAEFSKYNDSKTEMVVDFGEWRRGLRSDESFIEAFAPFTDRDSHVIMFRAFTEGSSLPLTVDRASIRKISKQIGKDKNGNPIYETVDRDTRFRSDVFFFITAEGEMDTEEQMKATFKNAGVDDENSKSASAGHKLVEIPDLVNDVLNNKKDYTDDLIYIVKDYSGYLTEFSAFVKDVFERIKSTKE